MLQQATTVSGIDPVALRHRLSTALPFFNSVINHNAAQTGIGQSQIQFIRIVHLD